MYLLRTLQLHLSKIFSAVYLLQKFTRYSCGYIALFWLYCASVTKLEILHLLLFHKQSP
jgi:hypothetical protein